MLGRNPSRCLALMLIVATFLVQGEQDVADELRKREVPQNQERLQRWRERHNSEMQRREDVANAVRGHEGDHEPVKGPVLDCTALDDTGCPNSKHGEDHPPVIIKVSSTPLVYWGIVGEMELTFYVEGAVRGFTYRIRVQQLLFQSASREQETAFSLDNAGINEVTVSLAMPEGQQGLHHFVIDVWDTYAGYDNPPPEALVARKELRSLEIKTQSWPRSNDEALAPLFAEHVSLWASRHSPRNAFLICYPQGGWNDMMSRLWVAYQYCLATRRLMIIDMTKSWFRDHLQEYITLHLPLVYQGSDPSAFITRLLTDPSHTVFPSAMWGKHSEAIPQLRSCGTCGCMTADGIELATPLNRAYDATVVVYGDCGSSSHINEILRHVSLRAPVRDLFRARYASLTKPYLAVHIRNTDYQSDVDAFCKEHLPRMLAHPGSVLVASDHLATVERLRQITPQAVSFAALPTVSAGQSIHDSQEAQALRTSMSDVRSFNKDVIVDFFLLAAGDALIVSKSSRAPRGDGAHSFQGHSSGFSRSVTMLHHDQGLVQAILSRQPSQPTSITADSAEGEQGVQAVQRERAVEAMLQAEGVSKGEGASVEGAAAWVSQDTHGRGARISGAHGSEANASENVFEAQVSGADMTENAHGDEHPPVVVRLQAAPVACETQARADGGVGQGAQGREEDRMALTFYLDGLVAGFTYLITVSEMSSYSDVKRQENTTTLAMGVEAGSVEVTVSLLLMLLDTEQQDSLRFSIRVRDTHPGLSAEEALVAGKEVSVPVPQQCVHQAILKGTVPCEYDSRPAFLEPLDDVPLHALTLVTQCSLDRLPRLKEQALAFGEGPISAAVFLPFAPLDSEERAEVLESIRAFHQALAAEGARRVRVSLLFANLPSSLREYDDLYPTNRLRNLALDMALTEMVLLVDVDFVPSTGLALLPASIAYAKYRELCSAGAVLVVAAFEVEQKGDALVDLPRTQRVLEVLYHQKSAEGFSMTSFPHGHGPTNFSRWFGANAPYKVEYRDMFEPFVIAWKTGLPRYDERFRGVCFDKISHLYEVAAKAATRQGGQFLVLPHVFIVAREHARSHAWERQLGENRDPEHAVRIALLWESFKRKVQAQTKASSSTSYGTASAGVAEHGEYPLHVDRDKSPGTSTSIDFGDPALVYRYDEVGSLRSMEVNLVIDGHIAGVEYGVRVMEYGVSANDYDSIKRSWEQNVSTAGEDVSFCAKAVFSDPEAQEHHRFVLLLLDWQIGMHRHRLAMREGTFAPSNEPERTAKDMARDQVCSEQEWVILLTVSYGYDDMFRNWLHWFRRLDLPNKLVIITEDERIHDMYTRLGLLGIQKGAWQNFSHAARYGDNEFKRLVSNRAVYLKNTLAHFDCVVFSDVDTVWLRSPIPFFRGAYDLWVSFDSPGSFCTGLMAWQNTTRGRQVVNMWIEHMREPKLNQAVFNDIVKSVHGLAVKTLDESRFPPGRVYFSQDQPREVVVVHNNWIVGRRNKINRFRKIGLWVENFKFQKQAIVGDVTMSGSTPRESRKDHHVKITKCGNCLLDNGSLHGDNHPPVDIHVDNMALVSEWHADEMSLTFLVVGAVPGFEYQVLVHELEEGASIRQEKEITFSIEDDSVDEITLLLSRRAKKNQFDFVIWVWDAYPGLSASEALVARKELLSLNLSRAQDTCSPCIYQDLTRMLAGKRLSSNSRRYLREAAPALPDIDLRDSAAQVCSARDRRCEEEELVQPRAQDMHLVQKNVTLATFANISQCSLSWFSAAHWDGPVSIVFHADSLHERVAIATFVVELLAPWCHRRSQVLSVKILFNCCCNRPGVLPTNMLRWAAVANARTPLVFFIDADVVPSTGALERIMKYFFDTNASSPSLSVLVLPLFCTAPNTNNSWPKTPQVSWDLDGRPQIALEDLSKDKLLIEVASGNIAFERCQMQVDPREDRPYSTVQALDGVVSKRHLPTHYSSWLKRRHGGDPYRTEYTLGYDPYFVVNRSGWPGSQGPGLFDGMSGDFVPGHERAQLSLEAATLGYTFVVHPGLFALRAPSRWRDAACKSRRLGGLGKVCELLERHDREKDQRAETEKVHSRKLSRAWTAQRTVVSLEAGAEGLSDKEEVDIEDTLATKLIDGLQVLVRRNEVWVVNASNLVECCSISRHE